MTIKTLAQILEEEGIITKNTATKNITNDRDSNNSDPVNFAGAKRHTHYPSAHTATKPFKTRIKQAKKPTKHTDTNKSDIKALPIQKSVAHVDKPTSDLHIKEFDSSELEQKRQQDIEEIKANRRLRWLAFYYLSTREHSAKELKEKLLNKNQNPKKVAELLAEFAEKGYQSEERTAFMLIREGIRKGRGRRRIKQDFIKRQIDLPSNIDALIDMANEQSAEFVCFTEGDNNQDQVNWLQLAIEARVRKYGADIPTDVKDKAKQLRFLQYRGFENDICFQALKYDNDSYLDNR